MSILIKGEYGTIHIPLKDAIDFTYGTQEFPEMESKRSMVEIATILKVIEEGGYLKITAYEDHTDEDEGPQFQNWNYFEMKKN